MEAIQFSFGRVAPPQQTNIIELSCGASEVNLPQSMPIQHGATSNAELNSATPINCPLPISKQATYAKSDPISIALPRTKTCQAKKECLVAGCAIRVDDEQNISHMSKLQKFSEQQDQKNLAPLAEGGIHSLHLGKNSGLCAKNDGLGLLCSVMDIVDNKDGGVGNFGGAMKEGGSSMGVDGSVEYKQHCRGHDQCAVESKLEKNASGTKEDGLGASINISIFPSNAVIDKTIIATKRQDLLTDSEGQGANVELSYQELVRQANTEYVGGKAKQDLSADLEGQGTKVELTYQELVQQANTEFKGEKASLQAGPKPEQQQQELAHKSNQCKYSFVESKEEESLRVDHGLSAKLKATKSNKSASRTRSNLISKETWKEIEEDIKKKISKEIQKRGCKFPTKKSSSEVDKVKNPKKGPKDARPYNRYNIYFILERENLLSRSKSSRPREPERIERGYENVVFPPLPPRFAHLDVPHMWYFAGRKRRRRPHRKTQGGAVGFRELGKTIAESWKSIDSETMEWCTAVEKILKDKQMEFKNAKELKRPKAEKIYQPKIPSITDSKQVDQEYPSRKVTAVPDNYTGEPLNLQAPTVDQVNDIIPPHVTSAPYSMLREDLASTVVAHATYAKGSTGGPAREWESRVFELTGKSPERLGKMAMARLEQKILNDPGVASRVVQQVGSQQQQLHSWQQGVPNPSIPLPPVAGRTGWGEQRGLTVVNSTNIIGRNEGLGDIRGRSGWVVNPMNTIGAGGNGGLGIIRQDLALSHPPDRPFLGDILRSNNDTTSPMMHASQGFAGFDDLNHATDILRRSLMTTQGDGRNIGAIPNRWQSPSQEIPSHFFAGRPQWVPGGDDHVVPSLAQNGRRQGAPTGISLTMEAGWKNTMHIWRMH